jgi:hypothetical protein
MLRYMLSRFSSLPEDLGSLSFWFAGGQNQLKRTVDDDGKEFAGVEATVLQRVRNAIPSGRSVLS